MIQYFLYFFGSYYHPTDVVEVDRSLGAENYLLFRALGLGIIKKCQIPGGMPGRMATCGIDHA